MREGSSPGSIAAAYLAACELDVTALKPGNVRDGAPFDDMTAGDFRASAAASAPVLAGEDGGDAAVGSVVRRAIEATRRVVQCNTNLGIVLLAAPLCIAARRGVPARSAVERQLAGLTRADASEAYAAIRAAAPGGLGQRPRHDVADEPQVTLREAMCEAAADDRIAAQYCSGYADVFDFGVPAWRDGLARFGDERRAASWLYMQIVAAFDDSHVVRRHGSAVASEVRAYARTLVVHGGPRDSDLAAWDTQLRGRRVNPGTSADLTVAVVLAAKLALTV